MVEVADELGVDGAAELRHLAVGGGDEDALHRLHQDVVEQGVLHPGGQPAQTRREKGFNWLCCVPALSRCLSAP